VTDGEDAKTARERDTAMDDDALNHQIDEVIGLIPAAGWATRMGQLPFSKELYPVALKPTGDDPAPQPRPVCEFLLESLRSAGVSRILVIVRDGKWDIPRHLEDGSKFGLSIGHLIKEGKRGAPYTIDCAYPYVCDAVVAMGFPDMAFECPDGFRACLDRLGAGDVDVVLGLFPADHPELVDMVAPDRNGLVTDIAIKPAETDLTLCWGIAVWRPSFSDFLHRWAAGDEPASARLGEPYLGDALRAAMAAGLRVAAVQVSATPFVDVGTPAGLEKVLHAGPAGAGR